MNHSLPCHVCVISMLATKTKTTASQSQQPPESVVSTSSWATNLSLLRAEGKQQGQVTGEMSSSLEAGKAKTLDRRQWVPWKGIHAEREGQHGKKTTVRAHCKAAS